MKSLLQRYPTHAALFLLVLGLLVKLTSYATGTSADLPFLPLIHLDVLVLCAIPVIGSALAFLALILELTVVVGQLFGMRYLVFLIPELIQNAPFFPIKLQVYLALMLLVLILLAWVVQTLARKKTARGFAVFILFLIPLAQGMEWATQKNMLGSAAYAIWNDQQWAFKLVRDNPPGTAFTPLSPIAEIEAAVGNAVQARHPIVWVLVESYGVFNDAQLRKQLDDRLLTAAVRAQYSVVRGERPFEGSTINGEFRDLCNQRLRNILFSETPGGCLPARLKASGYRTTAFHGNDPRFYRRKFWYPRIGFDVIEDVHSLSKRGGALCGGGWDGYCDLDLLDQVARIDQAVPRFDYVLTLNSHTPNEAMTRGRADLDGCADRYTEVICTHLGNLARVFGAIGQLLKERRNTTVIVSGDHAPRFLSASDTSTFSAERTPYFVFEPRAESRLGK